MGSILSEIYIRLVELLLNTFSFNSLEREEFKCAFNAFFFLKQLESTASRKLSSIYLHISRIFWQSLLAPWRLLFAFVPPYQIAHGWVAFICSLIFISGIAYIVTKLTDLISCVTGFLPDWKLSPSFHFFVISLPKALASGFIPFSCSVLLQE